MVSAQIRPFDCNECIEVMVKPGTTDSARWELRVPYPDGSEVTFATAWDTFPNVRDFGIDLYRNGGFIGAGRVPRGEDEITDGLIAYLRNPNLVNGQIIRNAIEETMVDNFSFSPQKQDTVLIDNWKGLYTVSVGCGFANDTMRIGVILGENCLVDPAAPTLCDESIRVMSRYSFWILGGPDMGAAVFEPDPYRQWRGTSGCTMTRIPEQ